MTCCKLLFAISTSLISGLLIQTEVFAQEALSGDIIPEEPKQVDKETIPNPDPEGKLREEDSGVIQMPAKKAPPRSLSKPKPSNKSPGNPKSTQPAGGSFQVPLLNEKENPDYWEGPSQAPGKISKNQAGIQLLANFFGSGLGLAYVYQYSSWLDWGFYASSTSVSLSEGKISDLSESLSGKMLSFKGFTRFSVNRKLYLGTGLSIASIAGTYGWNGDALVNKAISTDYKASLIIGDIFIGSEWRLWKKIILGVDWIGFGSSISGSINLKENSDLDLTTKVLTGSTTEERVRKEIDAQLQLYYGLLRLSYNF
ncbi:MAG: hypothetical protein NTX25_08220 [Proteobacteria bacterium]|nr:hypothetical protein [Pseudomonadota bacterium]